MSEPRRPDEPSPRPIPFKQLRTAARVALPAGTLGSAGLVLFAGRHNSSRLLPALFALWVLAPFAGLAWARVASQSWNGRARAALDGLTVTIAAASLALYAFAADGPRTPVFVVLPPVSSVLVAVAVLWARARRNEH